MSLIIIEDIVVHVDDGYGNTTPEKYHQVTTYDESKRKMWEDDITSRTLAKKSFQAGHFTPIKVSLEVKIDDPTKGVGSFGEYR